MQNYNTYTAPMSPTNQPFDHSQQIIFDYPNKPLVLTIQNCEMLCEHMINIIEEKIDFNQRVRQLDILHDCTDICGLAAQFLAAPSRFAKQATIFCAEICEACAQECLKFNDNHSQYCARICLHCANYCQYYIQNVL